METKILSWTFSLIDQLIQANIFLNEKVAKLERLNTAYKNTMNSLWKKNIELRNRSTTLKKKSQLNSQNSNLPPSHDLFVKNKAKSLRAKSENKIGGQLGHKGYTLHQVANPEQIVTHKVESCNRCGCCLKDIKANKIIKRQVFDIPILKYKVTEHQLEVKTCIH
jgi:transposase